MIWETVRIDQLGEIVTGNTPPRKNPEFYGDFIPFIKPTDIEIDTRYTPNPEECYSELGYEKYRKSLIPKGATCVVTIGSIGKKMTQAFTDCFINQAVNAILPNTEYDQDFVYYLLRNNLDKVKGLDSGTSSGRENVSKSAFSSIELKVVKDIPAQRRIASILSAYDDLIENNLKRIKLLEEKAFLRYKEIVRGEKLEEYILGHIASINGESLGKNSGLDSLLYIDISSVSQGSINFKTEYDLKEAPGRARRVVKHQDIIWSCVRPNRKSYAIIWEPEQNLIVSTGFAVISSREVSSLFLYHCLSDDSFVQYLENNATGSAYPAVTSKDFEKAKISLPSKVILEEYQKETEPNFQLIHNLQKQNAKLREARDILLPRLMSGELVV